MHQGSTCKVFVRNLFTEFPNGFDQHVRSLPKTGTAYALFKQERPMLMQLLGSSCFSRSFLSHPADSAIRADYISRHDPDCIVGHDFSQLDLDVLLNRMKELKIDNWSRIGRLRAKNDKWPVLRAGRNTNLLTGRLILDLTSDGTKVGRLSFLSACSPSHSPPSTVPHRLDHLVADGDGRNSSRYRSRGH